MHFHLLASTVGLLLMSSFPSTRVNARPVGTERRQGSTNLTTIITTVPSAFAPNGTNLANANSSIECYQGQYIDSGNFTLGEFCMTTNFGQNCTPYAEEFYIFG
ncbi:hypothetical protein GYMLUDRAFT_40635 [Collybiopsis luxurians FD-317 M1]|uniref:Uncharacterized protein n=1 Tax=Collybiopsis luxurians FD-317 M1 TaxID=944289 RepID=A0A0D0D2Z0_9AGAR|nr:hypothetical protein GYMLUDRAFT_40635 [Collybiopsis luxurians FD-317 M1]